MEYLDQDCMTCIQSQPSNSLAPLEPIQSNYTLKQVQIYLVNMRSMQHKDNH